MRHNDEMNCQKQPQYWYAKVKSRRGIPPHNRRQALIISRESFYAMAQPEKRLCWRGYLLHSNVLPQRDAPSSANVKRGEYAFTRAYSRSLQCYIKYLDKVNHTRPRRTFHAVRGSMIIYSLEQESGTGSGKERDRLINSTSTAGLRHIPAVYTRVSWRYDFTMQNERLRK